MTHINSAEGLSRTKRQRNGEFTLSAWTETSTFPCPHSSVPLVLKLLDSSWDSHHQAPESQAFRIDLLKAGEMVTSLGIDEKNFKVITVSLTDSSVAKTIVWVSSIDLSDISCCLWTEAAHLPVTGYVIEKNKIMSLVCRMGVSALDEMPGDNCQVIWRNALSPVLLVVQRMTLWGKKQTP